MSDAAAAMVVGQAMHSGGIEPEEVIAARQLQHNADVAQWFLTGSEPTSGQEVIISADDIVERVTRDVQQYECRAVKPSERDRTMFKTPTEEIKQHHYFIVVLSALPLQTKWRYSENAFRYVPTAGVEHLPHVSDGMPSLTADELHAKMISNCIKNAFRYVSRRGHFAPGGMFQHYHPVQNVPWWRLLSVKNRPDPLTRLQGKDAEKLWRDIWSAQVRRAIVQDLGPLYHHWQKSVEGMYDPEPDRVVALQSMKLKYWKDNYGQGKAYADLEKKAIAENKQPPPPQGPIAECTAWLAFVRLGPLSDTPDDTFLDLLAHLYRPKVPDNAMNSDGAAGSGSGGGAKEGCASADSGAAHEGRSRKDMRKHASLRRKYASGHLARGAQALQMGTGGAPFASAHMAMHMSATHDPALLEVAVEYLTRGNGRGTQVSHYHAQVLAQATKLTAAQASYCRLEGLFDRAQQRGDVEMAANLWGQMTEFNMPVYHHIPCPNVTAKLRRTNSDAPVAAEVFVPPSLSAQRVDSGAGTAEPESEHATKRPRVESHQVAASEEVIDPDAGTQTDDVAPNDDITQMDDVTQPPESTLL